MFNLIFRKTFVILMTEIGRMIILRLKRRVDNEKGIPG